MQRSNLDIGISFAQTVCFADDELNLIAYLMHRSQVHKMVRCGLFAPPCPLDQTVYELFPAQDQIDHCAVVMPDQSDVPDLSHRDRVRNLELAIPQVRSAGTYNESKILGNMQMLAIIHAHANEKPRLGIRLEPAMEVVVFQQ
mgnify:FL=1